MQTRIEQMNRGHAEKLLAILRDARSRGELLDAQLIMDSDWIHPATDEKLQRIDALEGCLERMLRSRARS